MCKNLGLAGEQKDIQIIDFRKVPFRINHHIHLQDPPILHIFFVKKSSIINQIMYRLSLSQSDFSFFPDNHQRMALNGVMLLRKAKKASNTKNSFLLPPYLKVSKSNLKTRSSVFAGDVDSF